MKERVRVKLKNRDDDYRGEAKVFFDLAADTPAFVAPIVAIEKPTSTTFYEPPD